MNKKVTLATAVILVFVFAFAGCGGGGGGGGTPAATADETPGGDNDPTPGGTNNIITSGGSIRLSGQIAIGSSSATASGLQADKTASIRFATAAANPFAKAAVSLFKIKADGIKETVAGITAITDAAGNYTLDNVPAVQTGTGAATDFYYEVRATSGSLEVTAPAAPTADATVNVSPETKIAAAMISDVARVPGVSVSRVLPSNKVIDILRNVVQGDLSKMPTFTRPPMETGAESKVVIAASAVSSNIGDSEKLMRAYETLKEALYLQQNRSDVTETRIAGFLDRAISSACNFHQTARLPLPASNALAVAFKNGTTFTPGQVAAAYRPDFDANSLVAAYNGTLRNLNTALTTSAPIPDSGLLGLYASRGDLSSIGTGSALQADQALMLLWIASLPNQQQPAQICQENLDFMKSVAALTGNTALAVTPSFADVEVYHSRMQCPEGRLEGRVRVYTPDGTNVSGVTMVASGMTNTSGQAISSVDFQMDGNSWKIGDTGPCVTFGQTYDFTITASLSSGGSVTTQVNRTIVDVPEPKIAIIAKDYSDAGVVFQPGNTGHEDQPIKLTIAQSTQRPLFKWSPKPGDAQTDAQITGAPAGSRIKYLFDVSLGGPGGGDPVACPMSSNGDKFFEKNYILSPIDCDVDACNTAVPEYEHVCRIHVQTVLVDEYDRTLGWSAAANLFYCIEGQSNCL